ncbi:hypothetical protein [Helicovermis profundi]|uniref:Uncharacterized protein n=1 Tax=Helicovermis profundi TaxID=3065157 RepID=A0AAU9E686_9FIRM|nr:hypothetical protein HLPR_25350 [Clostridia bacterium S502]
MNIDSIIDSIFLKNTLERNKAIEKLFKIIEGNYLKFQGKNSSVLQNLEYALNNNDLLLFADLIKYEIKPVLLEGKM